MKRKEYHFGDLDSEDEIIAAFEDLENRVANELEAIEVELSRCVKQKKKQKKGFVMNKLLLSIAAIVLVGALLVTVVHAQRFVRGDINYDIASNPELLERYLRDVLAESTYWRFTPQTSAPSGSDLQEGVLYYNDTTNQLLVSTDGSTFTALESSAGNSLDSSYDAGNAITVDGTAVTLNVADGDNNSALAIVSAEATNDNDAVTITTTTAGYTGDSLYINGVSGSTDIRGDSWNMSQAGVLTTLGIVTSTGDVTFTGANYNIIHDASSDQLEFNDSAEISWGTGEDITMAFDGTGGDLDITGSGLEIAFGADDEGIDLVWHTETSGDSITFDESAMDVDIVDVDIDLDDDANLRFGSSDDITIGYDGAGNDLDITGSGLEIAIGADDEGIDVVWHTENTGDSITFDESAADVDIVDIDIDLDDDANLRFGTSDDITIGFDGTGGDLDITGSGLEIAFGANDEGIDVVFHGETASANITWDESADQLVGAGGAQISLNDDVELLFGTGTANAGDFSITGSSAPLLTIGQVAAGTGAVAIGVDDAGLDVTFYGDTASQYLLWDTSEDTLTSSCGNISFTTVDAEADQFKVDATGAVAGDAINLETTDGGIMLNADGAANGDIELNSADDMIITSAGDTTITTTGTLSVAGSQITNFLVAVEEITAQTDNITAAESGKVIMVDYTGTATMTLPDAAAGLIFTFIDSSATAGDDLVIDCQAADTIDGDTAGDAIESVTDAVGQAVTLIAIDGTQWFTINVSGTWGQQ